jgi:hypothetical protein
MQIPFSVFRSSQLWEALESTSGDMRTESFMKSATEIAIARCFVVAFVDDDEPNESGWTEQAGYPVRTNDFLVRSPTERTNNSQVLDIIKSSVVAGQQLYVAVQSRYYSEPPTNSSLVSNDTW